MTVRANRIHAPVIVYFDAIRRAGSVREAARQLNIASSAMNRQLLKLEAELGTPLFERLSSGLRLTHAGETFARHTITVLQDAERVRSELDAMRGLRTGHVEIAAVEGLSSNFLPTVISRMHTKYPRISIGTTVMGSHAIASALSMGSADLGLGFSMEKNDDLRMIASVHLKLGALMLPDHPLASEGRLSLATCAAYPLILPKSDLSIYHTLRRALPSLPAGAITTNSLEVSKQLTLRGLGISFQTALGVETEIRDGSLVHTPLVKPQPLKTKLGVYTRSSFNTSVAAHVFAQIIEKELSCYCAGAEDR